MVAQNEQTRAGGTHAPAHYWGCRPAIVLDDDDGAEAGGNSGQPDQWDIPNLIRRARRRAKLSQQQLADALGLPQSVIARWELGQVEPRFKQVHRVLALADMHLLVVDDQGSPVEPMRDATVRDTRGRRYGAHLDVHVVEPWRTEPSARHVRCPMRDTRDFLRSKLGRVPHDHPTPAEVSATLELWREERRRALGTPHQPAPVPDPPCRCLLACEFAITCVAACPCQCQPAHLHPDAGLPYHEALLEFRLYDLQASRVPDPETHGWRIDLERRLQPLELELVGLHGAAPPDP